MELHHTTGCDGGGGDGFNHSGFYYKTTRGFGLREKRWNRKKECPKGGVIDLTKGMVILNKLYSFYDRDDEIALLLFKQYIEGRN